MVLGKFLKHQSSVIIGDWRSSNFCSSMIPALKVALSHISYTRPFICIIFHYSRLRELSTSLSSDKQIWYVWLSEHMHDMYKYAMLHERHEVHEPSSIQGLGDLKRRVNKSEAKYNCS